MVNDSVSDDAYLIPLSIYDKNIVERFERRKEPTVSFSKVQPPFGKKGQAEGSYGLKLEIKHWKGWH